VLAEIPMFCFLYQRTVGAALSTSPSFSRHATSDPAQP